MGNDMSIGQSLPKMISLRSSPIISYKSHSLKALGMEDMDVTTAASNLNISE